MDVTTFLLPLCYFKQNTTMAFLSKKEKEYCDNIRDEAEKHLPLQYRVSLLERAKKKKLKINGIPVNKHHLRNFKRGRLQDLTIAKLFKEEIDYRIAKLNEDN